MIWAGLTAKAVAASLFEQGILVRDRSTLAKMAGSVRVSVGGEAEMDLFVQALQRFNRSFALIFDLDDTLVDCSGSYDLGPISAKFLKTEGGGLKMPTSFKNTRSLYPAICGSAEN